MPYKIFHSYPKWGLSGVNSWTVNLVEGMAATGFENQVLFTGIPQQACDELDRLSVPYHFLNLPEKRKRSDEWQELKTFLELNAPCVYIPNYDFHRSCAIGTLSPEVKVCLVVHSDEACYFDEIRRLGRDCDAIVCVSSYLVNKVTRDFPELASIISYIPYGIPSPPELSSQRQNEGLFKLAYCNRLEQYQKRVFDLPKICQILKDTGIHFHLTIAGDGKDRPELEKQITELGLAEEVTCLGTVSNAEVMKILRESDVFLLTSDFEGLPISLLEAMSVGTVPVVYRIDSGINDAIEHDSNGLQIPHGDVEAFAAALAALSQNRQKLKNLSLNAQKTAETEFSAKRMCHDYSNLFEGLLSGTNRARKGRRSGKVCRPRDLTLWARVEKRLTRLWT